MVGLDDHNIQEVNLLVPITFIKHLRFVYGDNEMGVPIAKGKIHAETPFSSSEKLSQISATINPIRSQPHYSDLIVTNKTNKQITLAENTHIADIISDKECQIII